jgi:hypothetical protein
MWGSTNGILCDKNLFKNMQHLLQPPSVERTVRERLHRLFNFHFVATIRQILEKHESAMGQ